jgi:hypothetical protein
MTAAQRRCATTAPARLSRGVPLPLLVVVRARLARRRRRRSYLVPAPVRHLWTHTLRTRWTHRQVERRRRLATLSRMCSFVDARVVLQLLVLLAASTGCGGARRNPLHLFSHSQLSPARPTTSGVSSSSPRRRVTLRRAMARRAWIMTTLGCRPMRLHRRVPHQLLQARRARRQRRTSRRVCSRLGLALIHS